MSDHQFTIRLEATSDLADIERLCASTFGPGRFARSAYRLREGVQAVDELCFTARLGARLVGAIRFTSVRIGDADGALLLGPLAVDPEFAGQGCGRALVARGLEAARDSDYRLVLLVGDLPYYEKFGFTVAPRGKIILPGPVDLSRILVAELEEGVIENFAGRVTAA